MFCIHNSVPYSFVNNDLNLKLSEKDYQIYINPEINSETELGHYEYELCSSFPMLEFIKTYKIIYNIIKQVNGKG